tara:strand:- start:2243 stop:2737 length:495 start_codon:yes stop_codon:yes gene_type:complete
MKIPNHIFLSFVYFFTGTLAFGSIAVLYGEIKIALKLNDVQISSSTDAIIGQILAVLCTFFIMIGLTSYFLCFLVSNSKNPQHSQILTLNHLLFFYGFVTLLPVASVEYDEPKLSIVLAAPLGASSITVLVSVIMVIWYNYKNVENISTEISPDEAAKKIQNEN